MAKRATTEELLARLRAVREKREGRESALREILAAPHRHGIILKMAANLALESGLRSLSEELARAALAMMGADAAKRDPGCEGKIAAVRALVEWEAGPDDLFLALCGYRQMEAAYPEAIDTAGELRGLAALALARLGRGEDLLRLVDLLADKLAITRQHAAAALGVWRGGEAAALLRLKARMGDEDPEVLGETLASLLRHSAAEHRAFVAGFLENPDTRIVEMAALALGQSHDPEALPLLTRAYERVRMTPVATTLLMAIGLLRSDAGVDFLLDTLAKARSREAGALLDALTPYRRDPRIRDRLASIAAERTDLREEIDPWLEAS